MDNSIIALIIFVVTYIGIIFTRLPKVNIDRPSAAFFGAVAMIVFGVLPFQELIDAIDFNTICLLLGMMLIITTLQLDGFFSFLAVKTISFSTYQNILLFIIVFITGIASAFLVNDAVVLLFTPVIIAICRTSGINPLPYLIAEIMASNAGSAMTITGNPQNMLIGINSGISYGNFLLHLLPISILSMLLIVWIVRWFYPQNFKHRQKIQFTETNFKYNFKSMKFSLPIFLAVIVLFFFSRTLNLSIPVIALLGGSFVLIFGKIKPSEIIKNVDWVLLLFFASLFIVVRGIEKVGLLQNALQIGIISPDLKGVGILHGLSLVLSQVVSNVPFTVVMLPFLKHAGSNMLWLTLASASTLAGNATIIGAMANLIVIESAEKLNVKIPFWEFTKIGLVVTFGTFIISIVTIALQYFAGLI